jgi:hypothetical protein
METPSLDIIQKPFDPKYTKEWKGTFKTRQIFLKMYIQEKFKNLLYYMSFNELHFFYDNKPPFMSIFSKSRNDVHSFKNRVSSANWSLKKFDINVKKYISNYRNTTKRFSIHIVNLIGKKWEDYNVIALHDSKTNEIEFFQRDACMSAISEEYEISQKLLKDFFKYIYDDNVKFKFQEKLCVITSKYNILCSGINPELYRRNFDDRVLWILWYLELRLKNQELSRSQVLSKVIKIFKNDFKKSYQDTNLVCKILLGYSTFIHNFVKQFTLIKTVNGIIIKINKKKTTPLLKKAERLMKMYIFSLKNFIRKDKTVSTNNLSNQCNYFYYPWNQTTLIVQ